MASTRANPLSPNFILTPQQQNLLFQALTSNQPGGAAPSSKPLSLSPESLTQSPIQQNGSHGGSSVIQESPYLDNYDYSFDGDSSFDFDFANGGMPAMIGDLPATTNDSSDTKSNSPENDGPEKRGHEDDEDDEEGESNGAKRRESEGKVAKKPGRKPLTSEPSSKRKAQNRAAQRAFRERKEKHLKDLETKVEELEKASQTTNNENSQLRAQVEKMSAELAEYKKRLSLVSNSRSLPPSGRNTFGSSVINNLNDVDFQFEFPKFGVLPGPQVDKTNGIKSTSRSPSFPSPATASKSMSTSPEASRKDSLASNGTSARGQSVSDAQNKDAMAKFSGFFNAPSENYLSSMSRSSLDSGNFSIGANSTGSPSSSSNGNGGPSSSCGTSPEPLAQSPAGFKPLDTMATIGEEPSNNINKTISEGEKSLCEKLAMCCGNVDDPVPKISKLSSKTSEITDANKNNDNGTGMVDFTNFDWLSQQNGGHFDPQLFGDYREPQDSILASATFDDSFFNDAFDVDFTTPFNMAPSPAMPKKDLIAQIDQRKEEEDTIVPASNGKLLTCNNIWEQLQGCPKVQNAEIDLDELCSDLQKKAKCSGKGAVVDETDFKLIMTKHLGSEGGNCPSKMTN